MCWVFMWNLVEASPITRLGQEGEVSTVGTAGSSDAKTDYLLGLV